MSGRQHAVACLLVGLVLWGPRVEASTGRAPVDQMQVYRKGLPNLSILSLAQDPQGYLWIGTAEGLVRFDGVRFRVFDRATTPELRSNAVSALAVDSRGTLWIGTLRGLSRYAEGRFSLLGADHDLAPDRIRQLAVDCEGQLWVLVGNRLVRYDGPGFVAYTEEEHGLPAKVDGLLVDRAGGLWLTSSQGLGRLEGDRFVAVPTDGIQLDSWSQLVEDASGRLWLNAEGDLWIYEDGRFQPTHLLADLLAPPAESLLAGTDGSLWLGTMRGLIRVHGGRAELFTSADSLPSDWISSLFEDRDKALWIGATTGGLARWPAASSEKPSPRILSVVVEEAIADEQPRRLGSPLVLPPGTRRVEIHYTAIRFDRPEDVGFRYRLEGNDESWVDVGGRLATYTNLAPGPYRFFVEAYDRKAGRRARPPPGATLDLELRPALHQTWWFYTSLLVLGVVLFRGFHRIRIYPLQRRGRRLLELKKELEVKNAELLGRKAELRRLTFVISHDLRNPLFTIQGFLGLLDLDLSRQDALRTFGDLAHIRFALTRMEELLEELRVFTDLGSSHFALDEIVNLDTLVRSALHRHRDQVERRGVKVYVGKLGVVRGHREHLANLLRALLDNAFKFLDRVEQPRIEVSARRDSSQVTCSIRDNGIGIDPRYHEKVFQLFDQLIPETEGHGVGLAMAQRIVELHGGQIRIESSALGEGSTFAFSLPLHP